MHFKVKSKKTLARYVRCCRFETIQQSFNYQLPKLICERTAFLKQGTTQPFCYDYKIAVQQHFQKGCHFAKIINEKVEFVE